MLKITVETSKKKKLPNVTILWEKIWFDSSTKTKLVTFRDISWFGLKIVWSAFVVMVTVINTLWLKETALTVHFGINVLFC